MSDTEHSAGSRSRSRGARIALVSAIVALGAALVPTTASADGDPASDVLVSQTAFVPWDADASSASADRLSSVVAAAQRAGYPVKVAVIASASDLGSVTQLWRRPQEYADYLGVELSVGFHGSVIVVMPDGEGTFHSGLPAGVAWAALAQGRSQRERADSLTVQAAVAVEHLAAAAGHSLPASAPPTRPKASPAAHTTSDWIVFTAGLIAVALAWAASLRARPLGSPRVDPPQIVR